MRSTQATGVAAPPPPAPDPGARTRVGAATGLLDAYRPHDTTLFASPTFTLLGTGVRAEVPPTGGPLARRVADTLAALPATADDGPPLVMGAVPFDADSPAALRVPAAVHRAPALRQDPLVALPAPAAALGRHAIRPVPSPSRYAAGVAEAVARMERGEFAKVVLARTLEISAPDGFDVPAIVQRLARTDPAGYVFALPTGPGRTLLGASPELLVSRTGGVLTANPLAGSTPRDPDLSDDVRNAARLLDSEKDLREHAVVVNAIRDALAPFCTTLDIPERPSLVRTATMWHLSTRLTGELRDPGTTALDLATAMHPTPAVCGTPTALAREVIRRTEPFDRGFFTGMAGWQDATGDGEWVVTIRCAEADTPAGLLRLYAGAGVVPGSLPEAETAETAAKFRTFLRAAGAER